MIEWLVLVHHTILDIQEDGAVNCFLLSSKQSLVLMQLLPSLRAAQPSVFIIQTGTCAHDEEMRSDRAVVCMQEAGMMASMRHPNVVMYLGVCLQPPCVVTEYCARGSLNDVFKRARATPALAAQLDWGRRLNMVLDAAKGMMYLHSSEPPVIHRDLKSPNLLVDKHWRIKVKTAVACMPCHHAYSAAMPGCSSVT